MVAKSDFNRFEWQLLKDSPYWVQAAVTAAEGRMGLIEKRKEAKALANLLKSHKSSNVLVKAVLADQDEDAKVDAKATLEEVAATLEQIADSVEEHATTAEADGFKDFLVDVGHTITQAAPEKLIKKNDLVSDEEAEALSVVEEALRATDEHKRKRAEAEAAERRAEMEERRKELSEAKKAAQKNKEAEEAEKRLAEAQKKLEAAEKAAKERAEKAKKMKELEAERKKRLAERQQKIELKKAEMEAKRAELVAQRKKEAEEAAAAAVAEAKAKAAEEAAAKAKAAERIYEVKPGDSLSVIAKEVYGNAARWPEIQEANKDQIPNPNMIRPGQKLRIP